MKIYNIYDNIKTLEDCKRHAQTYAKVLSDFGFDPETVALMRWDGYRVILGAKAVDFVIGKEQPPTNWEPSKGNLVSCPRTKRIGKVIGISPPGMPLPDSPWEVLVKWNDPNSQDSWHRVDDLEFGSEYGGFPDPN